MWYIKDLKSNKVYGPFYSTAKGQLYAYKNKMKQYIVLSDNKVLSHPDVFIPKDER